MATCFPVVSTPRVSSIMIRSRCARRALHRSALFAPTLFALAACSTLPESGPTGHDIEHAAREAGSASAQLPFQFVEVTSASQLPPPAALPSSTLLTLPPPPTDLIGPGDVLNITVY